MANAKAAFQAVRKVKVYEGVARQIERLISEGSLKPGDKLPSERELAEMFRVSRSSLRDGIRKLELLGLVEARHGEGTIVRDLSADSLVSPIASMLVRKRQLVAELLDVRKMLEPPLAGRAATNASVAASVVLHQLGTTGDVPQAAHRGHDPGGHDPPGRRR